MNKIARDPLGPGEPFNLERLGSLFAVYVINPSNARRAGYVMPSDIALQELSAILNRWHITSTSHDE